MLVRETIGPSSTFEAEASSFAPPIGVPGAEGAASSAPTQTKYVDDPPLIASW